MTWQTILLAIVNPLLGAGILMIFRLWKRQASVEQTLYGQPGEIGLVAQVQNLRQRMHTLPNETLKAIGEVEAKVYQLQMLIPKRRSEL